MSTNNSSGLVICSRQKQLHLDLMLPENESTEIKQKIEEELRVECGDQFIPYDPSNSDFGFYGRRWHVRIVIDASREQKFYHSLRRFCEKHSLALDENGHDPFEKPLEYLYCKDKRCNECPNILC